MDIVFWILLGLILFLFTSQMMPVKGINNLSTEELKEMLQHTNKQFIDVRTPGEFRHHHIKEFTNLPLQQLKNQLNHLNPEKDTIVICQSGMRSFRAAKILKKAGFQHIYNIKSGMNAWN